MGAGGFEQSRRRTREAAEAGLAGALGSLKPLDIADPGLRQLEAAVASVKGREKGYPLEYLNAHSNLIYAGRYAFTANKWTNLGTSRFGFSSSDLVDGKTVYPLNDCGCRIDGIIGGLNPAHVHFEYLDEQSVLRRSVWGTRDHLQDSFHAQIYGQIHEEFMARLRKMDLAGVRVLDAGCGRAPLLGRMMREFPETMLYGIDYDPGIVAEANARMRGIAEIQGRVRAKAAPYDIRAGDAADLDSVFPARLRFGVIVSAGLIANKVVQHAQALRIAGEWHRRLEGGGHVLASSGSGIIVKPAEFRDMGFEVLQTCIPRNIFTEDFPKEMYVLRKP